MSPAETCRRNGWVVGDVLEGDEGYGPDRIMITAIGEKNIIAKHWEYRSKWRAPGWGWESNWTLDCRDWKKVDHSSDWRGEK